MKYVSSVEIDPNRESFTEHRLHLNSFGKYIISKQLALHILLMLEGEEESKQVIPIALGWEYEHLENTNAENNGPIDSNFISVTESNIITVPNSDISSHE